MIDFITNPIIASVVVLCVLCLLKVNVLISLLIAAIFGGILGNMSISDVMSTLIGGMGGNSETALSYILLGAFATAVTHTGLAPILSRKIASAISQKKFLLIWIFVTHFSKLHFEQIVYGGVDIGNPLNSSSCSNSSTASIGA